MQSKQRATLSRADDDAITRGWGVVMIRRGPIGLLRRELRTVAARLLVFSLSISKRASAPLTDVHNLARPVAEAILRERVRQRSLATYIRRASASIWGLTANGVATLRVLLGIVVARGRTTELNFIYHRTVPGLVVLSVGVLMVGRALPDVRYRAAR